MSAERGEIYTPASEADATLIVGDAAAHGRKLEILGGGTRRALGRPAPGEVRLSSHALAGIDFYEPAEMVIAAKAGTPLSTLEDAVAARGQMLPFEPIDHRLLYGSTGEPTVGGVVAANASGPRRINAGAARDALIGLRFVNGRGEIVKSGGRVTKNVTGLDLVKLNCGAMGTLGFLTQATFKLLPRPQAEATVVIRRLDDSRAVAAMARALGSPWSVSGAAHVSAGMGREFPRTFLRLEGFADSVAVRRGKLVAGLADFGAKHALEGEDSARLWRAIRDAAFLGEPRDRAIWRVSLAPSLGPKFIPRAGAAVRAHFYDWGGGLVWLAADPTEQACAAIRAAMAGLGGHATLVRAPDALRRANDVYEPLEPAAMALVKRLKASFDPAGALNAGRMYEGV